MITAQPISTRRRKTLLFNPARKAAGKPKSGARRRRANPGALIAIGPLNPTRSTTVKKKKQKKYASKQRAKGLSRRNPDFPVFASKKRQARHNPDLTAILKKPVDVLTHGLYATGGLLMTRQVPQLVLGSRNVGLIGYGANIIVALIAGAAAGAAFGPAAGASVMIGGGLYTVSRALTEQTPIGKHLVLSGAGDPIACGNLGALVPGYFAHPAVINRATGEPEIPEAIVRAVLRQIPVAAPAAATASTSLTGARFAPRF